MMGYNGVSESYKPLHAKIDSKSTEKYEPLTSSTLKDIRSYKGSMSHTAEKPLKIDYIAGKGVLQSKLVPVSYQIPMPPLKDFYCRSDGALFD